MAGNYSTPSESTGHRLEGAALYALLAFSWLVATLVSCFVGALVGLAMSLVSEGELSPLTGILRGMSIGAAFSTVTGALVALQRLARDRGSR